MKVKDKVIVVTGGGNGIGREIVLELLKRGANVAAIDISEDALRQTQNLAKPFNGNLSTHQLDITDLEAVNQLPSQVIEYHKQVDGLINNAGIIQPFIKVNELEYKKIEQVMHVNFYGPLFMIKAFLPYFLQRPEAQITNVSSMGGFVPVPGQTIYGASKAALKLLSEGLYSELKNTHIGVTTVYPGGVATYIMKHSGAEGTLKTKLGQKMAKMKLLTPTQAAIIIIDGMKANKYKVLAGNDSKMLDFMVRHFPKKAAEVIANKLA